MDAANITLVLVIVTALAFDFTNGFHDTANAMAASISTGALKPKVAVGLSAILNLVGAFLCARAAIPQMRDRRRGRIVNVASISATLGTAEASAYNASKWGLVGLTKSLAEELRDDGVQVLAVSPGSVDTAMLKGTPYAPQMTATDVARVVVWCCGEAPDAMTGANVEVFG